MELLSASGIFAPAYPARISIRPDGGGEWLTGSLVEWRWVDHSASRWEGLVRINDACDAVWFAGDRLVRVGSSPPPWSIPHVAAAQAALA